MGERNIEYDEADHSRAIKCQAGIMERNNFKKLKELRGELYRDLHSCHSGRIDLRISREWSYAGFVRVTGWMIKYANTCEMGGGTRKRERKRTRGEIADMTTAHGEERGIDESWEIAGGVNPICATSGVTAFHSLALIRLHYAKMSQLVQPAGN